MPPWLWHGTQCSNTSGATSCTQSGRAPPGPPLSLPLTPLLPSPPLLLPSPLASLPASASLASSVWPGVASPSPQPRPTASSSGPAERARGISEAAVVRGRGGATLAR
jgi:hypothetical protein